MKLQKLTVHTFSSTKQQLTISVGPIEELTITYDELAQMICDVTNAHLSDNPTKNWLGRAIAIQTNLFDYYEFALSIVKTSTSTTYSEEILMAWRRKSTSSK